MARGGFGSFLSGLTSGLIQGNQTARQSALDQMHAEERRKAFELQRMLAESLVKTRDADDKRLATKDAQAFFEKPIDQMMTKNEELSTDLAEVSSMGPAFAAAPETSPVDLGGGAFGPTQVPGRDFYMRQRTAALQAAGTHAEKIRKEREGHDIDKIITREREAADRKQKERDENIVRSVTRNVATAAAMGRINLPDGIDASAVARNLISDVPEKALLPTVPISNQENQTLTAIKTVEDALIEMKRLKTGQDTGPVSGRVNRVKSMFNRGNRALNQLDAASIRQKFAEVKAQSGAQYGMKELEQLASMVPDNTVNDQDWEDRWTQAMRFHESRKRALLSGLKSMRKNIPETMSPSGAAGGALPPGFIPEGE